MSPHPLRDLPRAETLDGGWDQPLDSGLIVLADSCPAPNAMGDYVARVGGPRCDARSSDGDCCQLTAGHTHGHLCVKDGGGVAWDTISL